MAQSAQNGSKKHKRRKTRMQANAERANNWWDTTHLTWYLLLTVGGFFAVICISGALWFASAAVQFVASAVHIAMQWLLTNLWASRVGLLIGLGVVVVGIFGIVGAANLNEIVKERKAEADRRKEAEIRRRIAAESSNPNPYGQ